MVWTREPQPFLCVTAPFNEWVEFIAVPAVRQTAHVVMPWDREGRGIWGRADDGGIMGKRELCFPEPVRPWRQVTIVVLTSAVQLYQSLRAEDNLVSSTRTVGSLLF